MGFFKNEFFLRRYLEATNAFDIFMPFSRQAEFPEFFADLENIPPMGLLANARPPLVLTLQALGMGFIFRFGL